MLVIPAPNDVAFSLGTFKVYWYGIIMAFAIFVSMMLANTLFNKFHPDYKKDIILSNAPIIIVAGILCARLYFCCLSFHYYFFHPLEIFCIREGGLSVHGAIIGGILSIVYISRKYKIPFLKLMDTLFSTALLGQSIGRWGNYFNSEAYGYPTMFQDWGLYIPISKRVSEFADYELFHPTFLYESVLDFVAFIFLLAIFFKFGKKISGLTFFLYLIFYSLIRFFTERIRVDSVLNLGSIPLAQIVSLLLFIVGAVGAVWVLVGKFLKRKEL